MHIVVERKLEATNLWFGHRALEVRLCDTPIDPPTPCQIQTIMKLLSQLELPPHLAFASGAVHDHVLFFNDKSPARWESLIARIATEFLRAIGQPSPRALIDELSNNPSIVVECLEFEVGTAALSAAARLATQLYSTGACDVAGAFEVVQRADERHSFGDATGPIIAVARQRGLPIMRLDDESRVQLGEGVYARRIRKAVTDVTGFVAEQISCDKSLTKRLWSQLGIPVAPGRVVRDVEDAVQAAEDVGWPVVVKPLDSDYSNGVTLNVTTAEQVCLAYKMARKESESVLVERTLVGTVHRFLVVDGRVISAVRRDPASVTGDGRLSISELVEVENQSPQRGPDQRWPLQRLRLETEELAYLSEQGLRPQSIPRLGQRIELRREPFLTTGGETHEVLEHVHPETLDIVHDAVRVVGLDIAGVDLIARDISVPLGEQGGGLLELNAQPAICLHLAPFNDKPQPVGDAIVHSLFPAEATGRIPLAIVIGDVTDPVELQRLARSLASPGQTVGFSTPNATRIPGRTLSPVTPRPIDRLAAMTLHPRMAASCLSAPLESILEHGLGTDHCRLLVLANSNGAGDLTDCSVKDLKRLLSRLIETADTCLVNVDDPIWGTLIEPGDPNLILCSTNEWHPAIRGHSQSGGRVAICEDKDFVIRSRNEACARSRLSALIENGDNAFILVAAALLNNREQVCHASST